MYNDLDLPDNSIDYEIIKLVLSDNGFSKTDDRKSVEHWENENTKDIVSFPRNENKVPADFIYMVFDKVNISQFQIDLYKNIIFNS